MDSTTTPAAPIAKTEPPSEQKLPSEIDILEERITLLTDLNGRVEKLRQTPSLLRVQSGSTLSTPLLREGFEQLKELSEKVKSEPTQDALNTAKESEAKDRSDLGFNNRRRNLKRARPPSPESPQPFRAFQPKATSLFPPDLPQVALQLDELIEYIKESNKSNSYRLHIWSPSAHSNDGKLPSPVIVRFTIRDVVIVYLTLGCVTPNSTIIVEGATAFGPREKKPAHSQSDFLVYQKLSQQLAKLLQSKPQAPFQLVMVLLASYDDLFVRRCTACQRVLSAEGHVPPVARVWMPGTRESEEGSWDARHPGCLQN